PAPCSRCSTALRSTMAPSIRACVCEPARSPAQTSCFPYTTLFRSVLARQRALVDLGLRLDDRLAHLERDRASVLRGARAQHAGRDRKSTRLNSSHEWTSYAVSCLRKKTAEDAPGPTADRRAARYNP